MAYVECPDCGLRLNAGVVVSDSCPRCLARGNRVALEPGEELPGRAERFRRARRLAETELREAGLLPPRTADE